jgi:hypothetical protein
MTDKSSTLGIEENQPTAERQRRPWQTPKVIKPSSVQRVTGTHHKSSGGDVSPYNWSVS